MGPLCAAADAYAGKGEEHKASWRLLLSSQLFTHTGAQPLPLWPDSLLLPAAVREVWYETGYEYSQPEDCRWALNVGLGNL